MVEGAGAVVGHKKSRVAASPYPAWDSLPGFYRAFLCLEQLVRFAVINNLCTHLMHRLRGWLRAFDEILGAAITAISELSGATVDIDRDHTRRWR